MNRYLKKRKNLLIISSLIALAALLAFLAPEEKSLGGYIRLIYIHAAATWVGLLAFAVSGLLALLHFTGFLIPDGPKAGKLKDAMVGWSSVSQTTAVIFWSISVLAGSVSAALVWGGNWWIEPRLRVAMLILVLALIIFALRQLVSSDSIKAALNLGLPITALVLLKVTGKLVHPDNAFAKSGSFEIKLFAILFTLAFTAVAIYLVGILGARLKNRASNAEVTS